jgi:hypothetical protein
MPSQLELSFLPISTHRFLSDDFIKKELLTSDARFIEPSRVGEMDEYLQGLWRDTEGIRLAGNEENLRRGFLDEVFQKALLYTIQREAGISGGGTKPEFFCGVENSILMTAEQFPYNERTENQYYYEPESVDLDCTYSPVIADFDPLLDSKPDIAFGCIDGYVFFGPTNPQDEDDVNDLFPTGLRFYTDPRLGLPTEYIRHLSMADLDGDGDYELIGITNLSRVFVWETGCTDSADIHWEQYLHDVGHTNYSDDW